MSYIQTVSIREFFAESLNAQEIHPRADRLDFAKAYLRNRLKINDQGFSIVEFLSKEAKKRGVSTIYIISQYAMKELNSRIEDGLMELVAETGLCVIEALKEDAQAELQSKFEMESKGWSAVRHKTAVTELEDALDVEIALSRDRPKYVHNPYNPFDPVFKSDILDNDEVFKSDQELLAARIEREKTIDSLPFTFIPEEVKKELTPADYDNMTEEEWQREKDKQAEIMYLAAENAYNNKYTNLDTNEAEKRQSRALSLLEEDGYPDFVYYPT
jgi:hypothetical protein